MTSRALYENSLVTVDGLASEKAQATGDRVVVCIPLLDIRVAGSQMGCEEAEAAIVIIKANSYSALVS